MGKKKIKTLLVFTLTLILLLTGCQNNLSKDENVRITDITMETPSDFIKMESTLNDAVQEMWYLDPDSNDGSNISIVGRAFTGSPEDLDSEAIQNSIIDSYQEQGLDIKDFTISEIEFKDIQNFETARYNMEYLMQGIQVRQIQLVIFSVNDNYTLTFTEMNDAGWIDDFNQTIESISIEYEEI